MSDLPENNGVTVEGQVSDTLPSVPPAKKPTAHQIATEVQASVADAHALIEALTLEIDTLKASASGGPVTINQSAGDPLTELDRTLLDNLPTVAEDIRALAQDSQDLNHKVGELVSGQKALHEGHNGGLDRLGDLEETVELIRQDTAGLLTQADHVPGRMVELSTPAPKILSAMVAVMRQVYELGKDKTADEKIGGYSFRSIDAAMNAVGIALRNVGVLPGTQVLDHKSERYVASGKTVTSVSITIRYTFTHPEDGSVHAFEMVGEGRDNGDKATSKAEAMAFKYALLQGLCIPTRGLPESDGEHVEIPGDAVPSRDVAPPAEEQPVRTLEDLAQAAHAKLQELPRLADAEEVFEKIATYVDSREGLAEQVIAGSTLAAHLQAVRNTFARPIGAGTGPVQEQPQQEQFPVDHAVPHAARARQDDEWSPQGPGESWRNGR